MSLYDPKIKSNYQRRALLATVLGTSVGLGVAVFGWFRYSKKTNIEQENAIKELEMRLNAQLQYKSEKGPTTLFPLEPFTVSVDTKDGKRQLRVEPLLKVSSDKVKVKVKEFLPVLRDRISTLLSSSSIEKLTSVEELEALGKEVALISNAVIEPQLTAIYVLQQQPSKTDLRYLEKIGAMPKDASGTVQMNPSAVQAAAQFWRISETDLPVQSATVKTIQLN
jgi:flagellar FliL protein